MRQDLIPSPSNADLAARLKLARALADEVRALTLPLFNAAAGDSSDASLIMRVENKGTDLHFDPVTNADKQAEQTLREKILAQFPDDHITGEEYEDITGSTAYHWTLDPIDGTRAFVAGVPVWSTLIAISEQDRPRLGLIDLPAMDQRFIGTPDGSWREDIAGTQKLMSRPCKDIRDIVLGCTEPLAMFTQGERGSYEMIRRTARFSRLGLDAFGYCLVASGRMDMILEADLKPCDVRALIPLIEGAGGKLTGWHGQSAVNGGRVVAAGDPDILEQVYPYLKRALS